MTFRRLAGDGAVYFGGAVLSALVPFLLLPILTRALGPSEFGVVGSFMAVVGVVATFVGLNTHGYVTVTYFRDKGEHIAGVIGGALGIGLMGGSLLLLLTLLLGNLISRLTLIPQDGLWIVVMVATGQFTATIALALFQAMQRPWSYIMVQFGNALLLGVLTLLLVLQCGFGWEGRAIGQLASLAIVVTLALMLISRTTGIDFRPNHWPLRSLLMFGVPLLPHSVAAIFIANMDRFFLASFSDAQTLGNYVAAAQVASLITVGATAANQAWLPWLFGRLKQGDSAADRQIVLGTWFCFGSLALVAIALVLTAPLLIAVVAGPGYPDAVKFLQLLAPACALNSAYLFVSGHLFYHSRTGLLSIISMLVGLIQVALSWWLGSVYGPVGVAIATAISGGIYWLSTWAAATMLKPMPWFRRRWSDAD